MSMQYKMYQDKSNEYLFEGDAMNAISPFSLFLSQFPNVLSLYTKEQRDMFDGVKFVLVDSPEQICECDGAKKIIISSAYLEFLWLSIYYNISFFLQMPFSHIGDDKCERKTICITSDVHMAKERCKEIMRGIMTPWPEIIPFPHPEYDVNDGSVVSLTSELMLYALGFLFAHELGHMLLAENGKEYNNMEEECMADSSAVSNYMCSEWFDECITGNRANAFKKKMIAMLEVGTMLTYKDQFREHSSKTHPAGIHRLDRMLKNVDDSIFNLGEGVTYTPKDADFDIRPAIGYAAITLYFHAQHILVAQSADVEKLKEKILCGAFDDPLDLYNQVKSLFVDNERTKH